MFDWLRKAFRRTAHKEHRGFIFMTPCPHCRRFNRDLQESGESNWVYKFDLRIGYLRCEFCNAWSRWDFLKYPIVPASPYFLDYEELEFVEREITPHPTSA